jgi:hypothetical protein
VILLTMNEPFSRTGIIFERMFLFLCSQRLSFLKSIVFFHVICFAYYLDIVGELIRQNDAALFPW